MKDPATAGDTALQHIYASTRGYCHGCRRKLAFTGYARGAGRGAWDIDARSLRPSCTACLHGHVSKDSKRAARRPAPSAMKNMTAMTRTTAMTGMTGMTGMTAITRTTAIMGTTTTTATTAITATRAPRCRHTLIGGLLGGFVLGPWGALLGGLLGAEIDGASAE